VAVGYQAVHRFRTRTIDVCVATDFYLRDQKPDWRAQLDPLFRQVNLHFRRAGVQWHFSLGGEAYPEDTNGDMAQRNAVLAETAACKADVILGLTGHGDRYSNSAVSPFSHTLLVALAPKEPEGRTATTIARALSNLYGVPAGTQTLVTNAADGEIFNDAAIGLISRLRDYDFTRGVAGLGGKWESRAAAALRDALAEPGRNSAAEAHRTLGRAFAAGRRHTDAVRQLREAVQASPQDASLRFELGLELAADSQADEAIAQLRECSRLDPEDARPRAAMGAIYLNSKRADEAIDEFRAATALDPRNAGYQSAFGEALSRQPGRVREAGAAFESALRLRPVDEGALSGLTSAAGMDEVLRIATQTAELRTRQQPGSPDAHLQAGLTLAYAGDLEGAEKEISRCLELAPASGSAHLVMARLKYLRGDYAAADSELRSVRANGTAPSLTFTNAVQRKLGK
jgi:Flp pilus assembly protein TadD